MAALTLIEAAKLDSGNVVRSAIIEMYAGSSDILATLPFSNIAGNAMKYTREASLPGVAFRGVNEPFVTSVGVLNPLVEPLYIAGGDLDVDKFILDTMGQQQRSVQEGMKVRALALAWTRKFIKGDSTAEPREFDGLQTRVVGNQLISAGTTANGAALSLGKLDEAIDQTLNPTHLIMNRAMARKLTTAARTSTVSGYVTYALNALGRRVMMYNDLPILTVDLDGSETAILGFTEASYSGTATSTSIYIASFTEGMLSGIQNGGVDVRDLGELETAPVYRTRVEWYSGFGIWHGRAVTRLQHIGDLPIVA